MQSEIIAMGAGSKRIQSELIALNDDLFFLSQDKVLYRYNRTTHQRVELLTGVHKIVVNEDYILIIQNRCVSIYSDGKLNVVQKLIGLTILDACAYGDPFVTEFAVLDSEHRIWFVWLEDAKLLDCGKMNVIGPHLGGVMAIDQIGCIWHVTAAGDAPKYRGHIEKEEFGIAKKIVENATGSFYLTDAGALLKWYHPTLHKKFKWGEFPRKMENAPNEIFIDIVAGSKDFLALTQQGKVYSWKFNSIGSFPLPIPEPITSIYAHHEQFWAVSRLGSHYTWGDNTQLQLGLSLAAKVRKPTKVTQENSLPNLYEKKMPRELLFWQLQQRVDKLTAPTGVVKKPPR